MKRAVLMLSGVSLVLAAAARADSVSLGYGGPGNVFDPGGQSMTLPRDSAGLSRLNSDSRTPSGLLYPLPYAVPAMTQSKDDPDWWSRGWIEGGVTGSFGGDTGSALLNRYSDFSSGLVLKNGGFVAENRKTAEYVRGLVENAGRADQYYQLQAGVYGLVNVTAFFDSIPHAYSSQARSIWDGVGTNTLTLKPGLVAGASTAGQVTDVAKAAPPTEVRMTREKAGLSVSYTPWKTIEAFVQLSNEWREGTQPISATFGYPFQNGATQIIAPVHYRTFDVTTALRYKDDDFQANLTYSGSFFRNQDQSLTWQNPGLEASGATYVPVTGRLSLPPSNSYHTLKGDMTALLSPDVRFSGSLSYSLMRQDEHLLPPTIGTGTITGAGGPINLDDWNSVDALSQTRAHAAIDIFNAFAQVQYIASPDLTLNFELRDRNETNRTNYVSFNPETGQYGYIAIDGGLAAFSPLLSGVYQPNAAGDNVQIRNMPFANDNLELTARANYRLDGHFRLDLSLVHNAIHHSVREVPDADDTRVRLQLATTGYAWGTVCLSYEYGSLSGSDYTSNPYTAYYSSGLPGYQPAAGGDAPFTLSDLRKFDIGDRQEHILRLQTNYVLSPSTDVQLNGGWQRDDYDAQYGLTASSSYNVTLDANYQLSKTATLTGFVTVEGRASNVAGINSTGASGSGAAGSAAYPLTNAWTQTLDDRDVSAGFTAHQAWDTISLDLNYIFTHADSALGYGYASTGAFFNQFTPAVAGNAFPDILFNSHSLQADARWQAAQALAWHLIYRVDFQKLDDFHYDDLTPVISNNTYLGIMPENFTVQTIGLSLQYTF